MDRSARRRFGRLWQLGTAAVALATVGVVSPAGAMSSGPGVCDGVRGCSVKARVDVDGDGTRDAVGVARRGKQGAPKGAVIVRVKTGPERIVTARVRTEYFYGPPWQGAADLDGREGNEIVVGFTTGAHGQSFRALTWRRGGLVTLDAPGRDRYWYIDSAMWIAAGWQHRSDDPAGTVRRRVATRTGSNAHDPFRGRITTFRWSRDGWRNLGTETVFPMSDEQAYRWGGFRVRGLARW